jgi:N-acetylmuramoyl-L-alanine amidase
MTVKIERNPRTVTDLKKYFCKILLLMGIKAMKDERSTSKSSIFRFVRGKRLVATILVLGVILMAATLPPVTPPAQFTVVLDAGHGGSDPGNLGTGRYKKTEKDVSLDVTLLVGKYIEENFPEIKLVYTRKSDTFPTLHKRVEIANNSKADLFISIHCNAAENKAAFGTETFVMGLHKTEESLKVAMRENATIFLEKDYEKTYQGFDPKDPDTYIILSMRENAYLDQSISLAKKVQDQFRVRLGRKDRGVKQAGHYVTSFTNMPAILVELGFLTNKEEEDFLHSDDGKTYIASAIYRAFKEFRMKSGGASSEDDLQLDTPAPAPVKVEAPVAKQEEKITREAPKKVEQPAKAPASVEASAAHPAVIWKEIPKGIKYQVQILSSPKPLNKKSADFKGLERIECYIQSGTHKYLAGSTPSFKEAKQMQDYLRSIGFKDAFVVAFENGQRVDLNKAIAQTAE